MLLSSILKVKAVLAAVNQSLNYSENGGCWDFFLPEGPEVIAECFHISNSRTSLRGLDFWLMKSNEMV